MAKNDQQEAFEKLLTSNLGRIIDFLKFAEAKNAALLTFSSAWTIGCINLMSKSDNAVSDYKSIVSLAAVQFALAAAIALTSFLPRKKIGLFHKGPERPRSLIFFGDISSFEPSAYKQRIRERYMPKENESATDSLLDDLSVQCAVISRITERKFTLFNIGAILCFSEIITVSSPVLANIASDLFVKFSLYIKP